MNYDFRRGSCSSNENILELAQDECYRFTNGDHSIFTLEIVMNFGSKGKAFRIGNLILLTNRLSDYIASLLYQNCIDFTSKVRLIIVGSR